MDNWSSGNKPSVQQHETKHDDSKPLIGLKTSDLSPSSSSPSSPSSSESSLELSTSRKEDPLGDLYTKSEQDASLSLSPESSSSPDVPNQTPQWSMISASPRGESEPMPFPDFPEWNGPNPSPMKSPPMHTTMGHPPGYDPNRIPSSIFSSKPNNGMEWSTASNESLFSIHMGNNSFSRDQFNMMYRSGELKAEEWNNSPANPYNVSEVKSNEKKNLPPNLPPLIEVATDKQVKSVSVAEGPVLQEKIVESPKIVPDENYENNIKEKASDVDEVQHSASAPNKSDGKVVHPTEASNATSPRLSNESGNSSSSFAFPVLLNDAGKTGSLKAPSAKMESPQPQPQPQPDSQSELQPPSPVAAKSKPKSPKPQSNKPESQPKVAVTSWFSCFSCWPRCC